MIQLSNSSGLRPGIHRGVPRPAAKRAVRDDDGGDVLTPITPSSRLPFPFLRQVTEHRPCERGIRDVAPVGLAECVVHQGVPRRGD